METFYYVLVFLIGYVHKINNVIDFKSRNIVINLMKIIGTKYER